MSLTITIPGGPTVIGPGAIVQATSDLLALDNPPYNWGFRFISPDQNINFLQTVVTSTTTDRAEVKVLWDSLNHPLQLLGQIHAQETATFSVQVEVRNQAGELIDSNQLLSVPWQPTVWQHQELALWSNEIVSRVGTGSADEKLDQILAAVYKPWPNG